MPKWNWVLLLVLSLSTTVQARTFSTSMELREDGSMIANGQGVSAPSFYGAMEGQNPAGLTLNQTLKIQGGVAAMDNSTGTIRESGGVLVGNGMLGAGLEYSQFNSGAFTSGGVVNWGLAGSVTSIGTTFGIAGHNYTGGGANYDLGLMFDFIPRLRIAGMLKNINYGIQVFGVGLNFMLDPSVDLVLDTDVDTRYPEGSVKPGITFHTQKVHFTAAYGYRYLGSVDELLYSGFSAGLGFKITENILLQYDYRALPQHRVGLTLRLN